MRLTKPVPYLKCVCEIPACPDLKVGDLLRKVTHRIMPGGYEYVMCSRRGDGKAVMFRIEHLEECFEVVEVDDEFYV